MPETSNRIRTSVSCGSSSSSSVTSQGLPVSRMTAALVLMRATSSSCASGRAAGSCPTIDMVRG